MATAAMLNEPFAVAVDASGNLYIADGGNNRIRKVTASGTITTVAGTGQPGYSGDGGAATLAMLMTTGGSRSRRSRGICLLWISGTSVFGE